jgi:hypothetical protein
VRLASERARNNFDGDNIVCTRHGRGRIASALAGLFLADVIAPIGFWWGPLGLGPSVQPQLLWVLVGSGCALLIVAVAPGVKRGPACHSVTCRQRQRVAARAGNMGLVVLASEIALSIIALGILAIYALLWLARCSMTLLFSEGGIRC